MSQFSFKETFFYNAKTALTFGAHKDEVPKHLYRFAFVVGTVLFPLSATLGAGVKTLIDYINRSELAVDELERLKANITQLDNEKLIIGAVVLTTSDEYKPDSWQARKLIEGLADTLNNTQQLEKIRTEQESKIALQRSNKDIHEPVEFTEFDEIAIEGKYKSWQAKTIRTLLLDFLNAVINIGRHQQQYIHKVYEPQQTSEPQVVFL